MDRSVYTACARLLLPLGAVVTAGCGENDLPAPLARSAAPALRRLSSQEPAASSSITLVPTFKIRVEDTPAPQDSTAPDAPEQAEVELVWPAEMADIVDTAGPTVSTEMVDAGDLPGAVESWDVPEPQTEATIVTPAVVDHFRVDAPSRETAFPLDARFDFVEAEDDLPGALDVPEQATAEPIAPPLPRVTLPWANAQPDSGPIRAAVFRADQRVRHGFVLAERGAMFSARAEFMAAMAAIAEAHDLQQSTRAYSKSLTAGIRALEELEDFFPHTARPANVNLKRTVAGHQTPVLAHESIDGLTPLACAERYVHYAVEQLSFVAADETAGSMALFGLGKVAVASTGGKRPRSFNEAAPAIVYFQSSLRAHPENFMAANELAVLMVDSGDLLKARELLLQSLSRSSRAVSWRNLAIVHNRLGQQKLAEAALQQAQVLEQIDPKTNRPVDWLEPDSFAKTYPATDRSTPGVTPAPAANPTAPRAADASKKNNTSWVPWRR